MKPIFNNEWDEILRPFFDSLAFHDICEVISKDTAEGKLVFPIESERYSAFHLCEFRDIQCVIVGQDPYHKSGQAMGLCFSVPPGEKLPPSLKNILKELESDIHIGNLEKINNGDLSQWAKQGVLLLNASLSVVENQPMSHANIGWQHLLDTCIEAISQKSEHVVFILWGGFSQQCTNKIDTQKHLVIQSAHPSPLSAYRGFFGSRPFSKANTYLLQHRRIGIDWEIR